MPSKTPGQQRLMGQAYAYKTGKLKKSDIDSKYRKKIIELANSMTEKQLKDFAETKHSSMKESMGFREFIGSSYLGGTGNRYEFGNNPEGMEEKQTIEELLNHINALSGAALNAISNDKGMENPYIKRRLMLAKKELREAYLRIMDSKR